MNYVYKEPSTGKSKKVKIQDALIMLEDDLNFNKITEDEYINKRAEIIAKL